MRVHAAPVPVLPFDKRERVTLFQGARCCETCAMMWLESSTEKFVSRLSRVTARGDASQPCAQPVRARAATAKSAERVCCSSALLCLVLIFA